MAVEIRCHATLRDKLKESTEKGLLEYELQGETTIRELASSLSLPAEELHLVIINGMQGDLDSEIKDGDRIGFFPPVGGG